MPAGIDLPADDVTSDSTFEDVEFKSIGSGEVRKSPTKKELEEFDALAFYGNFCRCFFGLVAVAIIIILMVMGLATQNDRILNIPEAQHPLGQEEGHCPYFSPTFPSQGGPDCGCTCPNGTRSVGTAFFDVFPTYYTDTITAVGQLITQIAPEAVTYVEGEHGFMSSHVSFSYYCCQTEAELATIKAVLEGMTWVTRNVTFSYATCAIDGPSLDHVSFIVMLDRESNERMMQWVEEVEARIEAAGVSLNTVRRHQEPYHSTLAVVNGSRYPVRRALREINDMFPPGRWLNEPINLTKPCNAHADVEEGFYC